MKQLSYLLQDISDEDRTDALDYYENYLDEAGFGYETDITNELGSPERIAANIRILPADPNQAKRMDRHSKAAVPFIREQSVPAPGPAAC